MQNRAAVNPIANLILLIFSGKTDNSLVQFIRYTLIGGFAFVADFLFLYILTEYGGLHYLLSATISFLVGLCITYSFSVLWIFNTRRFDKKSVEFFIFAWIGVVGLAINLSIMWLLTDFMLFHYTFSKIVSVAIVYFWNFFARKYALFN